jgi:hypothetical protein
MAQAKHGSDIIYRLLRVAHTAAALSFVAWWWSRPAISGGWHSESLSHVPHAAERLRSVTHSMLCLQMQAYSGGCCGPWTMRCRCCRAGVSSAGVPAGGMAAPLLVSSVRQPGHGSAWRPAPELPAWCRPSYPRRRCTEQKQYDLTLAGLGCAFCSTLKCCGTNSKIADCGSIQSTIRLPYQRQNEQSCQRADDFDDITLVMFSSEAILLSCTAADGIKLRYLTVFAAHCRI